MKATRAASIAIGACLLVSCAAHDASAQELRHDVALDATVTAVGGVAWITSELAKPSIVPSSCRWCDRDDAGNDSLNGVDRGVRSSLRWSNPSTAGAVSNVVGFVMTPLATLGGVMLAAAHEERRSEAALDALLVAEATVIAADVNQLGKYLFVRERPFVHARSAEERAALHESDDDLSFFSGHTTVTFAMAGAAGTIASLRAYRWAPAVWIAGEVLATTTGYLRIAADKHYFTDVAVGAVVGSAIGVGMPLLFHGRRDAGSPSVAASAGGAIVGWGDAW